MYTENPAIVAGFQRAYSYAKKSPCVKIMLRSGNCNGNTRRLEVGAILRELCKWKDVEIIQAEVCPDHIHMLVSIPPKMSVSSFMGFLKGKSSLMIYERWGDQKFKYKNREFWCKGYNVDTAGKDAVKIKEYIENQLRNDRMGEQLGFMDKTDPFTGSKD